MSDLDKKFKTIISNIEKNLKNQEDINYVKEQIYNMYTIFLDEFEQLQTECNEKVDQMTLKCKILDDRMSEIEDSVDRIQKDIYISDNEDYDLDINCPYCDTEFSVDFSEGTRNSVICPECNNTIELDWNESEHDGCSHGCHECGGDCGHHHDDEEDDM